MLLLVPFTGFLKEHLTWKPQWVLLKTNWLLRGVKWSICRYRDSIFRILLLLEKADCQHKDVRLTYCSTYSDIENPTSVQESNHCGFNVYCRDTTFEVSLKNPKHLYDLNNYFKKGKVILIICFCISAFQEDWRIQMIAKYAQRWPHRIRFHNTLIHP